MPILARENATIWFEERGEGEAVLLVHGGLFDPLDSERFWNGPGVTADVVSAGYKVIAADRRYHGRTIASFTAHSWQTDADDLAAVLLTVTAAPAYVVAGSNGCSAAARLALDHPEQVRGLILCWPANPKSAVLRAAFERSAAAVELWGPERYLTNLREHGVPRPDEDRPGFPFGFFLTRDMVATESFAAMRKGEAAKVFRDTAEALLMDGPLRGISTTETASLGCNGLPVTIIPAEPGDPYHPHASASALAATIPGAVLTEGYPVSPSSRFPACRAQFVHALMRALKPMRHSTPSP